MTENIKIIQVPLEFLKLRYEQLKRQLKQTEETKEYALSIGYRAKMTEIEFILMSLQGDKNASELLNDLIKSNL